MKLLQSGHVVHKERFETLHLPITVNVDLQVTVQVIGHSAAAWGMLTGGLATEKNPKRKLIKYCNHMPKREEPCQLRICQLERQRNNKSEEKRVHLAKPIFISTAKWGILPQSSLQGNL